MSKLSQKEPRTKKKKTQGHPMHVALPRSGGVWSDFNGLVGPKYSTGLSGQGPERFRAGKPILGPPSPHIYI